MRISDDKWYAAIFRRRSRRQFDGRALPAHIEIGANHEGFAGQWEHLSGLDVARFNPV